GSHLPPRAARHSHPPGQGNRADPHVHRAIGHLLHVRRRPPFPHRHHERTRRRRLLPDHVFHRQRPRHLGRRRPHPLAQRRRLCRHPRQPSRRRRHQSRQRDPHPHR